MSEGADWREVLEDFVRRDGPACVGRVLVLEEAGSTQDVAMAECRGEPGLLVVALRQTSGRGRLGRAWLNTEGLGVAMTLTVRAEGEAATALPIATGVAVAEAIAREPGIAPPIGIRWPNDVVERERGRKIAGILIESPARGLYLVGIGVNVGHAESDWPEELRGRACSMSQLGGGSDRLSVIVRVLRRLDAALGRRAESLLDEWRRFDVLRGRRILVQVGERQLWGVADEIEPTSHLLLRTDTGLERLPAATASLVRIEGAAW